VALDLFFFLLGDGSGNFSSSELCFL